MNQNPRPSEHHDELILFSERDKGHQVYSKLSGKRTSRRFHVPRGQLVWGQSESNLFWRQNKQPKDCKQGSQGSFRTLLGTKVKKGVPSVWSPRRKASFDREVNVFPTNIQVTLSTMCYIWMNFLKPDLVIPELLGKLLDPLE